MCAHRLGGVGKTQTAIEYCYRHSEDYRHIFVFDASSDDSLAAGFGAMAFNLGIGGGSPSESVNNAVKWLANNRESWLAVFDNVERPQLLYKYLPREQQGHIILTSRQRFSDELGITSSSELSVLENHEAAQFLIQRTTRDASEASYAEELARLLGNLPLALEQAAAFMKETATTFPEYIKAYRSRELAVLERKAPVFGGYTHTVGTTWSLSFERIEQASPAAATLMEIAASLGPFPVPIEFFGHIYSLLPATIKSRIDVDNVALSVKQLLQPLNMYSLIDFTSDGSSFSMHGLVRSVLLTRARAKHGLFDRRRIRVAMAEALPTTIQLPWDYCAQMLPHAVAECEVITQDAERTTPDLLDGELLRRAAYALSRRSDFQRALEYSHVAVDIAKYRAGEKDPAYAAMLVTRGEVLIETAEYHEAEALFRRAARIFRKAAGRDKAEARYFEQVSHDILYHLARIYANTARLEEALAAFEECARFSRSNGEHELELAAINQWLGHVHNLLGHRDEAMQLFERVIETHRAYPRESLVEMPLTLDHLAILYARKSRFPEAENLLAEAFRIRVGLFGRLHPDTASTIAAEGTVARLRGDHTRALERFREAFEIMSETLGPEHPQTVALMGGCAETYLELRLIDEARDWWSRATRIADTRELRFRNFDFSDTFLELGRRIDLIASSGNPDPAWGSLFEFDADEQPADPS